MIVCPSNPEPLIRRYSSIRRDKVSESLITLGSHTGTHADLKLHIEKGTHGVEALPLDSFWGKCKVLDITHIENEAHLEDLEGHQIEEEDIILLKTKNSGRGYRKFRRDYVHSKLDATDSVDR